MPNDEQTEQGELSQETTTEETVETTESAPEEKEDYRGKLNANNRFLEKEGYKFENGKWTKPIAPKVESKTDNTNVPIKDLHALRDVHEDDVDEVMRFAKFNGVSIAEAKKDSILQAILSDRSEKRTTASATHTGNARRSSNKVTDEALLHNASKGNIPEDDDEINRLVAAKSGYNKRK